MALEAELGKSFLYYLTEEKSLHGANNASVLAVLPWCHLEVGLWLESVLLTGVVWGSLLVITAWRRVLKYGVCGEPRGKHEKR